ncbi:hypothetical protein [Paenibacillus donghaensis]|uniref:Glycosyl hydrolases family 2 sugar binding domain-containing protein n=1 Tax=Paenibacillus donghaensis TaxID=414771 RepID=A0A2Z2KUK2_9BACL|nr:hypothetical protein [Paenibacillus donghaensis]ASA25782.1 hypothetical protein B9T62_36680 [Paenibacillus donghaensis]
MNYKNLRERFAAPDPDFGPVPFWWWSAEEITAERVRWQLQKFRSGGLRNIGILNIAPTGPQYGSAADDPPYFSERWWSMFEVALREAQRLGMRIFFYDQIGFSGSNFPAHLVAEQPELAGYLLRRLAHGEELPESAELLAESGGYRYITVRQGFNWLDKRATEQLYDRIYGEFERRFPNELGRTIGGSFQDELPSMPLWTKGLPELYAERYGEDLIAALPAMFEDVEGASLIRRRVYELATELAEEAVFKLQYEWHERHNMLQCCDQAGPARRADLHGAQRLYLDYMRTHRWYNAAGSDMDGEIKPHASMVHLHGGKRVFLESFHTSGWGGTMEETMHWLVPWLQAGVTLYSPHSVYYSTRGGWWEWAPPDTGWRQPYYEHYGVFADTVSRACWLLTQGTHVADVAVHYPSHAACGWMSLSDGGPLEHPMVVANMIPHEKLGHVQEVYQSLTGRWNRKERNQPGALRSASIDFDVTDDSALEMAELSDGKLRIGEESFSALLLCGTAIMDDAALARVKAWIAAGGLVIAVQCGEDEPLLEGAVYVGSSREAVDLLESRLPGHAEGPNMPLLRRTEDADIFLLLPEAGELLPMHEPSGESTRPPQSARYRLRTAGHPQLWDPVSGQGSPLAYSRDGEWVELEVPFDSWPAAFVVCPWDQAEAGVLSYAPVASDRLAQPAEVPVLDAEQDPAAELKDWKVLAVPTLDNRYGDFDLHGAQTAFAPIERRELLVAREESAADGVAANWHAGDLDDSGWMKRLWSEAAYWEASRDQNFEEGSVWPVVYSNTLGDLSFRTWAGRMGRVPRRFLNLGMADLGDKIWARTNVAAPEDGTYWLRTESNASIALWVNGEPVPCSGGPEEQTAAVNLKAGVHSLLLCAEALAEGLIRTGITLCADEQEPLPKWIYSPSPNPGTRLSYTVFEQEKGVVSRVRVIFCAKERVALSVNGKHMTEHGDFNPYIRQGQEEIDLTPYWLGGDNIIELVMQEGEGVVMVDGVIEYVDGSSQMFCTGPSWLNEQGQHSEVLHEAVLQFAETETMWLPGRKHPLPDVGWLMPDAKPTSQPLPFVRDASQPGKPIWLRFPLPAGATALQVICTGESECWIGGQQKLICDGQASFEPQAAGTMAALRIVPSDMSTETDVLLAPVRFEVAQVEGRLGDWRSALCLPHHSGVVEYETRVEWKEQSAAVLELGHVRGTAEVWLNGRPLGVRAWGPYRFKLDAGPGTHHLRIRVTNTLGTHYEIGRPSSNVGGSANPKVSYWQPDTMPEHWETAFAAGGLYGPVRLYALN